jgi:hypothetical protein
MIGHFSLRALRYASLVVFAVAGCSSEKGITDSSGCGFGVFGGSCGGSGSSNVGVLGSTSTTGPAAGTAPYSVRVSQAGCTINQQIGRNDPGTFVPACGEGANSFELRDLPQNCAVDGANPLTMDVRAGSWTRVHFAVLCT